MKLYVNPSSFLKQAFYNHEWMKWKCLQFSSHCSNSFQIDSPKNEMFSWTQVTISQRYLQNHTVCDHETIIWDDVINDDSMLWSSFICISGGEKIY